MKKILLSVVVILFATSAAWAQNLSFGPKVGVNFATVNGLPGAKVRTGLTVGVFVERQLCSWMALEADLLWSEQGFRTTMEGVNYETRLNYINMPIVTKHYLVGGLNLQLGAQFGYLITAKEHGADQLGLKSAINKYNADILVGMAYDFDCGFVIEGRYNIGLTNIQSLEPAGDLRNGLLQVMVGWKF